MKSLKELIQLHELNGLKLKYSELNSFYRNYMESFAPCSEAPSKFILTVLFSALGSSISLSRWITWGTKKIYPNFWTIIIGESTRARKTTALHNGLYFIKKRNEEDPERNFLLPSHSSMASLLDVLEYEKNGIIEHSEIATFLEVLKKGYNGDMKSLLTTLFDVPVSYKRQYVSKENANIEYPIFSLATATTPIWLKENLKHGDATSGFLARFLFAIQMEKTLSIPIPKNPDSARIEEINQFFLKVYALSPHEITFDSEFEEIYSAFYHECDDIINGLDNDIGLNSIIARIQTDYFLKFVILECVIAGKTTASAIEAERAVYLAAFYITQAKAVIHFITPSKAMMNERKILEYIKKEGSATRTDLHRFFHNNLSASELNSLLTALKNCDLIISKPNTKQRCDMFVLGS
jgi:hypothetical protein